MRLGFVTLFAFANTGCFDPCVAGESVCSGDHILACGGTEGDEFRDFVPGCGDDRCMNIKDSQGLRVAVCSASGELDPRCDPNDPRRIRICADDATVLRCNRGFSFAEEPCAAHCVAGVALCSPEYGPSAACTENGLTCEAGAVIHCSKGWVVDRTECGAGERCMTSPLALFGGDHLVYCASEATTCDGTDIRCTSKSRLAGCVDGHAVAMSCSDRYECDTFTVLSTGTHEAECIYR